MILLPLVLYLSQLPLESTATHIGVPATSSLHNAAAAATTLCFAYQGQTIFPEIRSEMVKPSTFPRAVVGSVLLMTFVYLVVGVIGSVVPPIVLTALFRKVAQTHRQTFAG